MVKNPPAMLENLVQSLGWEDPLEEGMANHSSVLVWKILVVHGYQCLRGSPGGSVVKNLPVNAGYLGSIPGLGRFPGRRLGNPLQFSCLGNPMDRGDWRAIVHGVAES